MWNSSERMNGTVPQPGNVCVLAVEDPIRRNASSRASGPRNHPGHWRQAGAWASRPRTHQNRPRVPRDRLGPTPHRPVCPCLGSEYSCKEPPRRVNVLTGQNRVHHAGTALAGQVSKAPFPPSPWNPGGDEDSAQSPGVFRIGLRRIVNNRRKAGSDAS